MSYLYLFRHGQAGTRHDYDTLSGLGREQARRLGAHLAAEGLRFSAVFSGSLKRQWETCLETLRASREAGVEQPEPRVDAGWNEFDMFGIYAALAPRLCADDEEFRRGYEEMLVASRNEHAEIQRRWMPCDMEVVWAWVDGRYSYSGESWEQFLERVRRCRERLPADADDAAVAVFTSATPVAIVTGLALGVNGRKLFHLAGALMNTSITVLRGGEGGLDLVNFNGVPHLPPEARTIR